MSLNRDLSNATWYQIDDLLHKITKRASTIGDKEIFGHADLAIALLRNHTGEIQMEDEKASMEKANCSHG